MTDALARIDALNARDPNRDAAGRPKELAYSERLTGWVLKLRPDAPEALRIAARGQHVERWTLPRAAFPEGRVGYLNWRENLKRHHAQRVGGILAETGYPPEFVEEVRSLILKKNLRENPLVQTLEDALCLLFLETQFEDLKSKTPDDKMIEIVRKTWAKMSDQGRREALALPLPAEHKSFLGKALA